LLAIAGEVVLDPVDLDEGRDGRVEDDDDDEEEDCDSEDVEGVVLEVFSGGDVPKGGGKGVGW
jgi:hypothetical protein